MEFEDKDIARGAADMFFQELLKDAERLQTEKKAANSPPQHDIHQREMPHAEKSYVHTERPPPQRLQQGNSLDASFVLDQSQPQSQGEESEQKYEVNACGAQETDISRPPKSTEGATSYPITRSNDTSSVETGSLEFKQSQLTLEVAKTMCGGVCGRGITCHSSQVVPRMTGALSSNPTRSSTPRRHNHDNIHLEQTARKHGNRGLPVEGEEQGDFLSPRDSRRALPISETFEGTKVACSGTRLSAETLHVCTKQDAGAKVSTPSSYGEQPLWTS